MTRRSMSIPLVAAAALALTLAGPVSAAGGAVTIGEANNTYFFAPKTTYVNVGGAVTWKNGTDAPHTVTSDAGGELTSGTIAAGAAFSHTFSAVGTFKYHCAIHTYMTAKVVVLAAGATPPATDTAELQPRGGAPGLVGLVGVLLAGLAGAGMITLRLRTRG